ncbi:MAG: signal peptidase II [Akkermansiaceae bacterium]|nr:signal peptidase II [Akkermansiaceae bacterium]
MTKNRTTLILILIIAFLYVADQVSKWAIVLNFEELRDVVRVVTDCPLFHLNIVRAHNQGVAFGMGDGTVWAPFVFLAVQVVALTLLVVFYRRGFFCTRLLKAAWVCIMAGVLGNMTDRLLQGFFLKGAEHLSFWQNFANGYVVDFLDFSFPWISSAYDPVGGYHWPAFNVADSCVCIAAGLFLIASFFEPKPETEKVKD